MLIFQIFIYDPLTINNTKDTFLQEILPRNSEVNALEFLENFKEMKIIY